MRKSSAQINGCDEIVHNSQIDDPDHEIMEKLDLWLSLMGDFFLARRLNKRFYF